MIPFSNRQLLGRMKVEMTEDKLLLKPNVQEWITAFEKVFPGAKEELFNLVCLKTREIGASRENGMMLLLQNPDDNVYD